MNGHKKSITVGNVKLDYWILN